MLLPSGLRTAANEVSRKCILERYTPFPPDGLCRTYMEEGFIERRIARMIGLFLFTKDQLDDIKHSLDSLKKNTNIPLQTGGCR
jgi:hypothetical protein